MKEIADILKAYQHAEKSGKKTALATVVKVEGSSYRRPGARMLITEDGILTGAISGGCLEGDALRKALAAIHTQENKLVTYDTTDEDDAKFGVQLGCNGIVHILFEPIKSEESNPIALLTALQNERAERVLVTFFSIDFPEQIGTSLLYRAQAVLKIKDILLPQETFAQDVEDVFATQQSQFKIYALGATQTDAFIEFIKPSISLIIAGAGNDAQPLAEMAYLLGWKVSVIDGRPTHASAVRFPNANCVTVAKANQFLQQCNIDSRTAFVLMTHNYNYDLDVLNQLLDTNAAYIGTLGPKKKLIRMLDELNRNTAKNESRIHGPIGLDIGAETAEEIAVSIIAEIKSVFSGASAKKLKEKKQPIHIYGANECL